MADTKVMTVFCDVLGGPVVILVDEETGYTQKIKCPHLVKQWWPFTDSCRKNENKACGLAK